MRMQGLLKLNYCSLARQPHLTLDVWRSLLVLASAEEEREEEEEEEEGGGGRRLFLVERIYRIIVQDLGSHLIIVGTNDVILLYA